MSRSFLNLPLVSDFHPALFDTGKLIILNHESNYLIPLFPILQWLLISLGNIAKALQWSWRPFTVWLLGTPLTWFSTTLCIVTYFPQCWPAHHTPETPFTFPFLYWNTLSTDIQSPPPWFFQFFAQILPSQWWLNLWPYYSQSHFQIPLILLYFFHSTYSHSI